MVSIHTILAPFWSRARQPRIQLAATQQPLQGAAQHCGHGDDLIEAYPLAIRVFDVIVTPAVQAGHQRHPALLELPFIAGPDEAIADPLVQMMPRPLLGAFLARSLPWCIAALAIHGQ